MSILFVRLPPRCNADDIPDGIAPACPFVLASDQGGIEQEGCQPLGDFANVVAQAQQVVLLLAASDVALLHMAVPPLSPTKLKAALPHLVEEQLLSDPFDCVIVAGPQHDGMRCLAVMQRDWLELLSKAFLSMGAGSLRALPIELCLPFEDNIVSAALCCHDTQCDLSMRLSQQTGLGLSLLPGFGSTAARETVAILRALLPHGAIKLHIAASEVEHYAALSPEEKSDITLIPDAWHHWIVGAAACRIDLIAGLSVAASGQAIQWRTWRWPLILASAVVLLNVTALNLNWWQLHREALQLQSSMLKAYRSAYPKEIVVLDPLAQVRRKILLYQQADGQLAQDDFLTLAAQFSTAWNNLGSKTGTAAVAAIQYRDSSLFVQLANHNDSATLSDQLKHALADQRLTLSQTSSGWQIKLGGGDK